MFLLEFVILFTEGGVCLSACWDTRHPQIRHPPQEQTPPQSRHPPGSRHHPRADNPPQEQTLPPPDTDYDIRSMSGRYASYWNAFLLYESSQDEKILHVKNKPKKSFPIDLIKVLLLLCSFVQRAFRSGFPDPAEIRPKEPITG